jgi:hypothetical protein
MAVVLYLLLPMIGDMTALQWYGRAAYVLALCVVGAMVYLAVLAALGAKVRHYRAA